MRTQEHTCRISNACGRPKCQASSYETYACIAITSPGEDSALLVANDTL